MRLACLWYRDFEELNKRWCRHPGSFRAAGITISPRYSRYSSTHVRRYRDLSSCRVRTILFHMVLLQYLQMLNELTVSSPPVSQPETAPFTKYTLD